MEKELFNWEGWDAGEEEGTYQFNNCEFKVDFGPWKKGEKPECMIVDYQKGKMIEYKANGNIVKEVNIYLSTTSL